MEPFDPTEMDPSLLTAPTVTENPYNPLAYGSKLGYNQFKFDIGQPGVFLCQRVQPLPLLPGHLCQLHWLLHIQCLFCKCVNLKYQCNHRDDRCEEHPFRLWALSIWIQLQERIREQDL